MVSSKYLSGLGTLGRSAAILTRMTKFSDFLFGFLHIQTRLKRSLLFRVDNNSEGDKNN